MKKSIISEEEKRKFENFFERKLEGIDKSIENEVEVDKVKTWLINKDDSGGKDNFKDILDRRISSFRYNNDETNGMLINCEKGDGISWLAEKILDISNTIKDNDDIVETIKKEESRFPVISKLIGSEKKLINLAIDESLIEKYRSSFGSNVILFFVTLVGAVMLVPNIHSVLEQIGINLTISQWRGVVGFIIIVTFVYNLYNLIRKLRNDKKKEGQEFLKKIKTENIEEDCEYKSLIDKVVNKIDKFEGKKIIIIDDIALIDKFSQDVILKYIENKSKKNKKIFWIIFSSNQQITSEIRSKGSATFFELALLLLSRDEKKKLCTDLKLDKTNVSFDTIKDISKIYFFRESKQSLSDKLSKLKESNLNLFNFLYLLALNGFPPNSKYIKKRLIEGMSPRKEEREKDKYVKKIFGTKPTQEQIESYFNDGEIKKYYEYDEGSDTLSIDENISCLIENNPNLFDYEEIYKYGQEYWALSWYFSFRKKPQVRYIKKISHHLQSADSGIEDVEVRIALLEAHLFTAEKSLSYLQKKDTERVINHAFKMSINGIHGDHLQRDRTTKIVLEAFMNFDSFPDIESRFEDLDCEDLYKFLKTKDTSLAHALLENKSYASVSDHLIYFMLEQYWERLFFLWIFYKEKEELQYSLIDGISTELAELNTYFEKYFKKEKDKFSSLYLFNLALYIWIDYIRLLGNDGSIQTEQIIQNIKLFLFYHKKIANANISKDDICQLDTIQESICLIVSIVVLLLKKQDVGEETKDIASILQDLKNIFNEVDIDIKNYNKSIDEIMRFLLLHSLKWKNCGFNVRYTILSIIRTQLFLFSSDSENISGETVEKAKAVLRIAEQADSKNHLTTLLYFSLYSMNSNIIKDKYRSSYFFQQTLGFTSSDKISNTQFEYLYFCIRKCWYVGSEKMQEALKCFIKCSNPYFNKIVERICEYPNSYMHICNCLNCFNNELENMSLNMQIDDTEYTFISFFSKILKQAQLKESVNLEDAECIWENYIFENRSVSDKRIEQKKFEQFWQNRKNNPHFGVALKKLFVLSQNNIHGDTMRNAYNFLMFNAPKLLYLSPNLILACHFCDEKRNKRTLDEEYTRILNLIKEWEPDWERAYKDINYYDTAFLYDTLFEHTKQYEYYEKKKPYELLKTQKRIENFEITNYTGFFYSLWEIFKNDLGVCDDISSTEEQLLKGENIREFLESTNRNSMYAVVNGEISLRYLTLLLYLKNIEFAGKENMEAICENLAKSNINNLIQLIMQTSKNRKYLERIQGLFEELSKSVVFDDE
ncbi:MAG: hypothetical protein FWC97_01445 [Treponema sp.]|nr:hypothetical protein [Treponema sp.]